MGLIYDYRVDQTPRFAFSASRRGFPTTLTNLSSILALNRHPTNGPRRFLNKRNKLRMYHSKTKVYPFSRYRGSLFIPTPLPALSKSKRIQLRASIFQSAVLCTFFWSVELNDQLISIMTGSTLSIKKKDREREKDMI